MAKKTRRLNTIALIVKRLFCKRNIIVVAEHNTGHIPLSMRAQLGFVVLVLGAVSWVSYSTGSYMEAQSVIAEKDLKIASTKQENSRIESEFNLLKRDLVKLVEEEKDGNVSDYAQFMIEQYNDIDNTFVGPPTRPAGLYDEEERKVASQIIFERVAYLEQVMEDQRNHYKQLMEEIESVTDGKIKELQTVISKSGLDIRRMERRAQNKIKEETPQGGPYEPLDKPLLLEQQYDDLYGDLERLQILLTVTEHMPMVRPMEEARITSSFGARRDPFTGRRAQHGGMDFVGEDRNIFATADGVALHAGKRGAYGNLIEIDHGLGITTRFGHLSKVKIEAGQKIYKGQLIGVMGNTGRSTGAHLHYEVRLDNKALNPYHFLKAGNYVQQKSKE